MSYQLLTQDVLFYQRFLKANELYKAALTGHWDADTNLADAAFITLGTSIAEEYGSFDQRSEANIVTLVPKAQVEARKFLKIAAAKADVRIISGTRTYDEQNALYRHGRRGVQGPVITNAKGGQSNHNFGIAWDVGIFDSAGHYLNDDVPYKTLAAAVLPLLNTIEWGGNWHSFKDFPHYQLKAVSESVSAIRQLFENGDAYLA